MRIGVILALVLSSPVVFGQWELQESHVTADLRGIHYVGDGVAWASGTHGTVLRTGDMGKHWQLCALPPDAVELDFRGVQAFDNNTAVVMSSGPGDKSRLYKTTDGCRTWTLVATNPDKEGFWDALRIHPDPRLTEEPAESALVLGDSVQGGLRLWEWKQGWEERELELSYEARGPSEGAEGSFAASNSVLQIANTPQMDKTWKYRFRWASNTPSHSYVSYVRDEETMTCEPCRQERRRVEVPMSTGSASAGIFSFAFRTEMVGVAVGGDYMKVEMPLKNCAYSSDGGLTWSTSLTSPHGYRSSVAYEEHAREWITVGPNGTDVSTDDGRNWRALKPSPGDAPDADRNWNALSLPFVVGPKGRIGLLRKGAVVRRPLVRLTRRALTARRRGGSV